MDYLLKDGEQYLKVLLPVRYQDYNGEVEGIWIKINYYDPYKKTGVGQLANAPFGATWVKSGDWVVFAERNPNEKHYIISKTKKHKQTHG